MTNDNIVNLAELIEPILMLVVSLYAILVNRGIVKLESHSVFKNPAKYLIIAMYVLLIGSIIQIIIGVNKLL